MSGICFEDVAAGEELPPLIKGPMSTAHIMRWTAATENWHRIHYDWKYATVHDKLPDVVINGARKRHVLIRLVTDWAGESGWRWRIRFQFRGMNVPGETLTLLGAGDRHAVARLLDRVAAITTLDPTGVRALIAAAGLFTETPS